MNPLDYRYGQEPIVGLGAPDTRPCVARITAKAAGEFLAVEPYVQRDEIKHDPPAPPESWPWRVERKPDRYRRRVRMGIDDRP